MMKFFYTAIIYLSIPYANILSFVMDEFLSHEDLLLTDDDLLISCQLDVDITTHIHVQDDGPKRRYALLTSYWLWVMPLCIYAVDIMKTTNTEMTSYNCFIRTSWQCNRPFLSLSWTIQCVWLWPSESATKISIYSWYKPQFKIRSELFAVVMIFLSILLYFHWNEPRINFSDNFCVSFLFHRMWSSWWLCLLFFFRPLLFHKSYELVLGESYLQDSNLT